MKPFNIASFKIDCFVKKLSKYDIFKSAKLTNYLSILKNQRVIEILVNC